MGKNTKHDAIIQYIVQFLLGEGNEQWADCISYENGQGNYVNIIPSSFFEQNSFLKEESMPDIPLVELEGIPLLYGSAQTDIIDGKIITHADIIASTFFLISRYEEVVRRNLRDNRGRFPGIEALPVRAGFIHRPVVEEYGVVLRGWLRKAGLPVEEPSRGIRKVYLTHDVDVPYEFNSPLRRILSAAKDILVRRDMKNAVRKLCHYKEDVFFSAFEWLKEQDNKFYGDVPKGSCRVIYFLICGGKVPYDSLYSQNAKKTKSLLMSLRDNAAFGLHASYHAGRNPQEITNEAARFAQLTGKMPVTNRYHFLTCREPEDLRALRNAGITDDFTFAYADVAGFRLGTCRPVKWIDIDNMCVTELTLHPMTIMECTLDRESYMNLSEDDAGEYARKLIDEVYNHAGEVVLLWHNTSVAKGYEGFQRRLYCAVLEYMSENAFVTGSF